MLCMKCQGIHTQSMEPEISEVKMTEMDAWSYFQIQCMWNGGNQKFRDFLEGYSLNDPAWQLVRYRTVAAAYYRRWLMASALGQTFDDAAPDYNEGRKEVPKNLFS